MTRRPDTAAALRAWALAFNRSSPPPKVKAARPGKGEAARKNYQRTNPSIPRRARQRGCSDLDALLLANCILLAAAVGVAWGVLP